MGQIQFSGPVSFTTVARSCQRSASSVTIMANAGLLPPRMVERRIGVHGAQLSPEVAADLVAVISSRVVQLPVAKLMAKDPARVVEAAQALERLARMQLEEQSRSAA